MKISKEDFEKLKSEQKNFIKVKVLTPSMHPLIRVKDQILVERRLAQDINPYDILVFWQNNKLICHFFIKKVGDKYICRGLNNKDYDDPIALEDIFGIVVKPSVGPLKRFFLRIFLR